MRAKSKNTRTGRKRPLAPVTVSAAVVAAVAAHEKARAAIDKFCARPESAVRSSDEKTLGRLVKVEVLAAWALVDVEPASVADVALILRQVATFTDEGHILPERGRRKGEKFARYTSRTLQDDLIKAAAGWLASLAGVKF